MVRHKSAMLEVPGSNPAFAKISFQFQLIFLSSETIFTEIHTKVIKDLRRVYQSGINYTVVRGIFSSSINGDKSILKDLDKQNVSRIVFSNLFPNIFSRL